ncbi:diguanylate cyclase (GGDEF)-like protein [Evansella vedderi]|uniref:Diguanylate cyclase (GGDEF)-like protein n=1 Tax=Evansella vedderi TaxID=38282 RepID=A0ABU0A123_9BACI|nr:GGDEF domain-containing protein [Evansella vedderi]MDQ0256676.1 diguanylate cyclase (GGDEF)-like protein [Evansella vedderi]
MFKKSKQKKHRETVYSAQNRILEMLATNTSIFKVLKELVYIVEEQVPGAVGVILLTNKKQSELGNAVGPNLPQKYIEAINGLKISPEKGSCGPAAYHGKTVVVSDITSHPFWKNDKGLALQFGFKSCWSIPIFSPMKEVVGIFALYFKERNLHSSVELEKLESYIRLAGIVIDYKKSEAEKGHSQNIDFLTGLPDAIQFKSHLEERIKEKGNPFAVVFFDLDRFSVINNIGGYEVGDGVLKKISNKISQCIDEEGILARWNSDKFIGVIPYEHSEDIKMVIEAILKKFLDPFEVNNHEFLVTPSIGISCFPQDGADSESLVKNAEIAMKKAKREEKNTYVFYTPSINETLYEQVMIEKYLRQAIKENQFVVHYQPQINLMNENTVGLEALIRWQHPKLGLIPPNKFIRIAEETGLIVSIGEWVLRNACEQINSLNSRGYSSFRLSVNLSSIQFSQRGLVEMIQGIISDTGMDPTNLVLEVTESTLVENIEFTVEQLNKLKAIGVQIALDDFGTLYSSLNYLKHFPMDIIKIDRSFIRNIEYDDRDLAILKTIIRLGKDLKLKVLAEGIETERQLNILKKYQCDEGQGYYFDPPISLKEVQKR